MSLLVTFSQSYLKLTLSLVLAVPLTNALTGSALAQNSDPSIASSPRIQVAQTSTIIFVSPNGADTNTGLSADQPLRSITAALSRKLPSGTIIQLGQGTYSVETGEKFPLNIPAGVILRGNPDNQGQQIIITGGDRFTSPTFAPQNIAMLAGDGSRIEGITLTNTNPRGYALWLESSKNVTITNNTFANSTHDGIFLTGEVRNVNISGNIFTKNGANGISALGTSTGTIQSNTFEDTGFGLAIGQRSQVAVIANRITKNRGGAVISNLSTPSFRNNLIADNQENGLVILKDRKGQPTVDLGTPENPGQNIFQNNKQTDINNASGVTVIAIGNQIDPKKIQGPIDLVPSTSPIGTPDTPTTNVSFNDVPSDYWALPFIQGLASRNIIKGFPDGNFRPNAPVTRAQFAAMLNQAITKNPIRPATNFSDVPANNWAFPAIQKSYAIGFMSGYPKNTFKPNENISRVQILVALANGFGYAPTQPASATLNTYFTDAPSIPSYAINSIAAAAENRMVVNFPDIKQLNPNQTATRAEVAALIYQALVRSGQVPAINSPYVIAK
ncbi:MAG: S-layer homology domain-containing protein [Pseudanabaenaceae cyanobacterium bins.39]|nr:S-layer homology domain-containing protein [Pseudanabaenaceae cyanobacterium bins.39]